MTPHTKKLIGAVVMLVWLMVYILVAAREAKVILPHAAGLIAFFYYAIAGTLWIVPIGFMLPWMYREPKPKT